MRLSIALILSLLVITNIHSQEQVLSFKLENASKMKKKDGYSFSNEKTGDLAMLLVDGKTVFASLFDANFIKKASIEARSNMNKKNEILGYTVSANNYSIVSTNSGKKKYFIEIFDFDAKKVDYVKLNFNYGNEKFLETFQYKNELYLITATKMNAFILRKLNQNHLFSEVKRFDIEAKEKDQKLLTSGFFIVGLFGSATSNVTKVDNRVPNAIEQTAKSNKLYQALNKIFLTIENKEALNTTLHIIDLESLQLITKVYDYPTGQKSELKKFNSYILEDNILQLGCNPDEMVIKVNDFQGYELKSHYIDREKPIDIKNSPIIQEGQTFGPFVNRREMEETSKFLRKVSSGNIGITGYRNGDNYMMTIGGYKEVSNGGVMLMGGPGMGVPMGSGGTGTPIIIHYNPTFYSFSGYTSTKSTFFNTTMDANFNYVEKENEANIFERIKTFKKELMYDSAEEVFFHNGLLYFGYHDNKEQVYHLYKM